MKKKQAGLYVIYSADKKKAYVGETEDLERRKIDHSVAIRLGCEFCSYPLAATKLERLKGEELITSYIKSTGIEVVSYTHQEASSKGGVLNRGHPRKCSK